MTDQTKPCIACDEPIKASAKLCKHCQTLQDDTRFTSIAEINKAPEPQKTNSYLKTCSNCGSNNDPDAKECQICGATFYVRSLPNRATSYRGPVETPGVAIAAIICAFIFPILGLILGYSARREIRASNGEKNGDGLATAAIVIGWIEMISLTIWIVLLVTAVSHVAATETCVANSDYCY